MLLQKFAEQESLTPQAVGTRIPGKEISQFVAKYRCAARLQNHDGQASFDLRREHPHDALQILLGPVEHAKVVQRPAAAQMAPGDFYVEPCVRKYFKCRPTGLRLKVIIEGVCPEDHAWRTVFSAPLLRGPLLKADGSELRHLSLRCKLEGFLQPALRPRGVAQEVGETRSESTQRRPAVDHAEGVGVQRASLCLVVMRQKLCLISGEIHVRRAFRFTGLACQA